jgi:hypothetical protein
MSVIEASSVRLQTMADGTLRITCDVEPRFARDAFALFGSPGVPMALAALVAHKTQSVSDNAASGAPVSDKPKGGLLSQWCAMRCQEPEFQEWMRATYPNQWAHAAAKHELDADTAAEVVRNVCRIGSRADLDHSDAAAKHFDAHIRHPWQKHYMSTQAA